MKLINVYIVYWVILNECFIKGFYKIMKSFMFWIYIKELLKYMDGYKMSK